MGSVGHRSRSSYAQHSDRAVPGLDGSVSPGKFPIIGCVFLDRLVDIEAF
jgi:hypothetical protein